MAGARNNAAGLRRHLTAYVERSAGTLAQETTRELRKQNPKDTTWSSTGWLPSAGRMPQPLLGGDPVGREAKLALVGGALAAQEGAIAAVMSFRLTQAKIYIPNFVRYIGLLNRGYSGQASSGWVQRSMFEGIARTYAIMRAV